MQDVWFISAVHFCFEVMVQIKWFQIWQDKVIFPQSHISVIKMTKFRFKLPLGVVSSVIRRQQMHSSVSVAYKLTLQCAVFPLLPSGRRCCSLRSRSARFWTRVFPTAVFCVVLSLFKALHFILVAEWIFISSFVAVQLNFLLLSVLAWNWCLNDN